MTPVRGLLFAFLFFAGVASAEETIKIAVMVGLSGTNAIYGEGQLNGFKAAADLINAQVARALEGLHYAGPTGDSWMRSEDHQIIAPILVMSFVKAGTPGAKHDIEATGYGWKTETVLGPKDTLPPVRCTMERPS